MIIGKRSTLEKNTLRGKVRGSSKSGHNPSSEDNWTQLLWKGKVGGMLGGIRFAIFLGK